MSRTLALPLLAALLAAVCLAGVAIGALPISPGQALAILADRVGLELPWHYDQAQAAVLLHIRLPRVVLAVLVGAALATAGATLQGLFRNPLADPGLIGVSSGAALAAATAIVVGGAAVTGLAAELLLPVAAFAGGVAATAAVWRIASQDGTTAVATLLLAGVALNSLAGAGLGVLIFLADDAELRSLTFWSLGSLGGATWTSVAVLAPFVAAGFSALPRLASALDLLTLGEREAAHLGVSVERVKRAAVIAAALAVGAAVALTGVIGFIGLVVPHIVRLALGPGHRVLLPAAALLGAVVVAAADLIARTAVAPAELPIGVISALFGAPFFLWLLRRERPFGAAL